VGLWKKQEYIIQQAQEAMQKHGWTTLPSAKLLRKRGYEALVCATKFHGGFDGLRRLLGQEKQLKERDLWRTPDYICQQAQKAMQEQKWDILPGAHTLCKLDYNKIVNAAESNCNGLRGLRKLLGQPNHRVRPGSWKDQEFALQKAREAMKEQGWEKLPSHGVLTEKRYHALCNAAKYHNGLRGLRKLLGQENSQEKYELMKSENYIIQQVRQAMAKFNWQSVPTIRVLKQHRLGSVVNAIFKHHGGMTGLRKLLGEERVAPGAWRELEYTIKQAQKAMQNEGWTNLPALGLLRANGYGGMLRAIQKYHGGLLTFRKLIQEHSSQPSEQQQLEVLVGGYVA